MLPKDIEQKLKGSIESYFNSQTYNFIPGETKIPLSSPTYGAEEVMEALDSLLTKWVTMGKKVKEFENLFAEYVGVKYAVMVNSGSSANLLALSVLTNPSFQNRIKPGEEIITPATTWITTAYPIANVGAVPVFVDVEKETFNIDPDKLRKAITDKTRAIMPVHLLGNPVNIKEIMDIAHEHNLWVIEDACEAHGAEVAGRKVGSFGDMGTFSFFFSHHISTIEGGMIVTNNEDFYEMLKSMRVFGWIRDSKNKDELAQKYKQIDPRFLFVNLGYNLRPTEVQGAFGIHQIKKLEKFIQIRRENADYWKKRLSKYSNYLLLHEERPGTRHVWLGYPITVKENAPFTKEDLENHLEKNKIETRPIVVPNILEQPSIKFFSHKVSGDVTNSKFISRNSFFFGDHQGIGKEEREFIADTILNFIEKRS